MTQQQEQQIIDLDGASKSVRAISKITGIPKTSVHRFLIGLDAEEIKEGELPEDENIKQDENDQSISYNGAEDHGFPWPAAIALLIVIIFFIWLFFGRK